MATPVDLNKLAPGGGLPPGLNLQGPMPVHDQRFVAFMADSTMFLASVILYAAGKADTFDEATRLALASGHVFKAEVAAEGQRQAAGDSE